MLTQQLIERSEEFIFNLAAHSGRSSHSSEGKDTWNKSLSKGLEFQTAFDQEEIRHFLFCEFGELGVAFASNIEYRKSFVQFHVFVFESETQGKTASIWSHFQNCGIISALKESALTSVRQASYGSCSKLIAFCGLKQGRMWDWGSGRWRALMMGYYLFFLIRWLHFACAHNKQLIIKLLPKYSKRILNRKYIFTELTDSLVHKYSLTSCLCFLFILTFTFLLLMPPEMSIFSYGSILF